jgi:hypothetical protein
MYSAKRTDATFSPHDPCLRLIPSARFATWLDGVYPLAAIQPNPFSPAALPWSTAALKSALAAV